MALTDSAESENGRQVNVVLQVVQFEQVPFEAYTRSSVDGLCTRLNFAVYDSSGKRVVLVNQKEGDDDFGRAALSLDDGTYQLVVLAHSSDGNPTMTNPAKINFTNQKGFTDTFLYYGQLTVGETTLELALTLRRIVAKVRFVAEDALPAGATQVRFYYTGGAGTFDASTGYGSVASKQVVVQEVSGGERQFEIYTIPHAEEDTLTVTVSAHSEENGTITNYSEKQISGIPIRRNRVTVCRGKLFDGESSATHTARISISIEDTWGADLPFSF